MFRDVKDMIFHLLEQQGKTARELGEYIGVKPSSISAWKNENSYPSSKLIVRISEFFGVSPTYLCTGFDTPQSSLSKSEQELLDHFRGLSDNEQQLLLGTLSFIVSYQRKLSSASSGQVLPFSSEDSPDQAKAEIAVYDMPASAGTGLYLDSDKYQLTDFPEQVVPRGTSFGVRISGYSMLPGIEHGEVVFVKRQPSLEDGDIGIFILNGEVYCKRYRLREGSVLLESDNRLAYPLITVKEEDDLRVLGKVIGHARP